MPIRSDGSGRHCQARSDVPGRHCLNSQMVLVGTARHGQMVLVDTARHGQRVLVDTARRGQMVLVDTAACTAVLVPSHPPTRCRPQVPTTADHVPSSSSVSPPEFAWYAGEGPTGTVIYHGGNATLISPTIER